LAIEPEKSKIFKARRALENFVSGGRLFQKTLFAMF
jgi:hypothetical protein